MGKFIEKKNEIAKAAKESNRVTFNETAFDELGTALLNEADYTTTIVSTSKGEKVETVINPVAGLRKGLIGSVAKAAGCDAADQEKLIAEHQFSKLPLHGFISELLENYTDAGKSFAYNQKSDFQTSLYMEKQEETVKEIKTPKTGEVVKCKYAAYRKMKVKSVCPANLREKL